MVHGMSGVIFLFNIQQAVFVGVLQTHCIWKLDYDIVYIARRFFASLSPRRPGIRPGSVHVRFVFDKVALGKGFVRGLRFSPVSITPPTIHSNLNFNTLLPEGQAGEAWEPSD
jgi:hypothetical protein